MDNQHRKISGYRELTQGEINLINRAKELEAECLKLQLEVQDKLIYSANDPEEAARLVRSNANRWVSIAKTDIETGFMALVRSIAQPQPR